MSNIEYRISNPEASGRRFKLWNLFQMLSEFSDFGIRISDLSKVKMYRMLKPFFCLAKKRIEQDQSGRGDLVFY